MVWKSAKRDTTERRDAMAELTDKVIAMIESNGKVPWKREWDPSKCAGPQAPVNAFTKDLYHGFNSLYFGLHPQAIITGDPRFATFKQAENADCNVKKGAKGIPGIYYKPLEVDDAKAEDGKKQIGMLKSFHVFHASDIEGLPTYKPPSTEEAPWTRPEAVTTILNNMGVTLRIGGDRASYSPTFDTIQMPPDVAFSSREYWAATIIHEINHSTGHPTRMNRDLTGKFGSVSYSQEESRVEMAAAFVCNVLNLPTDFDNHAAYVAGWLKKLKEDRRELFKCAADAQKIASYVLALHPEFALQAPRRPDEPIASKSLQEVPSA